MYIVRCIIFWMNLLNIIPLATYRGNMPIAIEVATSETDIHFSQRSKMSASENIYVHAKSFLIVRNLINKL